MTEDNLSNKRVLVLLFVGTSSSVLGGQERRWARIVGNQGLQNKHQIAVLINKNYLRLLSKTEIKWKATKKSVIPDFNNKWINAFFINLAVVFYGMWYDIIQVPNQSLIAYPSAIILKIFFRKRLIFSYTGTTIDGHQNDPKKKKYANRVKLLANFADVTEVLNPRVLLENWPKKSNVVVAPCSFSDPNAYHIDEKRFKIVFAGHFYQEKGIDLLKRIILGRKERACEIAVYGSPIQDKYSAEFNAWICHFAEKNDWLQVKRLDDMTKPFADAMIVLSLQTISNYPSQVVLEGMLSGCQTIITKSGDSCNFGINDSIFYVQPSDSANEIWEIIDKIHNHHSTDLSENARNYVLQNHTEDKYCRHLSQIWIADSARNTCLRK